MASRLKEDEKNERLIRGLLKLPANRRCINCNSLGPQYVCTNFWTFVCTTCSGMHREFTHRVKSVSMAKFSSEEVNALMGGGNERAKEIYFKDWDPHRHSQPDNINIRRLREFIKHVYVDRKYSGEKSIEMAPKKKLDTKRLDSLDIRDALKSGSRTPAYENTFGRHFMRSGSAGQNDDRNKYGYNHVGERRDSGYLREIRSSPRRNVTKFEVVDDRVREDRFGNRRRAEIGKPPSDSRERNSHKSLDMSNLPAVRSVREILGEDVPPLCVDESPKANSGQKNPGPLVLQKTPATTNGVGPNNVKPVEQKIESLGSLIDFDVDPKPPDVVAQLTNAQHGQTTATSVPNPSANADNWGASLDFCNQPTQDSSKESTLDSIFSQVSAPTAAPVQNIMHSAGSEFNPSVSWTQNNQSLNVSLSQNAQGTLANSNGHPSHGALQSIHQHAQLSDISQQGHPYNQTAQQSQPSTDRRELPLDLFAAAYSPVSVQPHAWQTGPSCNLPFGMQHSAAAPYFPHQSKSVNPFDLNTEPTTLVHAPSFPTVALQGALPQIEDTPGLLRTTSLGPPAHNWMVPQTSPYGGYDHLPSRYSHPTNSNYHGGNPFG
ncbi:hypothetical protein C5167_018804 [Papaver somniferum]|uniref:Arf-GAP domain-containing protein n=1 Tax=Papaver somniferum TaxID=3469 RepID=A0A4Y7INB8_PAPSO|nr:hypothetical protein C5167_018804 [Papaver somniferum]